MLSLFFLTWNNLKQKKEIREWAFFVNNLLSCNLILPIPKILNIHKAFKGTCCNMIDLNKNNPIQHLTWTVGLFTKHWNHIYLQSTSGYFTGAININDRCLDNIIKKEQTCKIFTTWKQSAILNFIL